MRLAFLCLVALAGCSGSDEGSGGRRDADVGPDGDDMPDAEGGDGAHDGDALADGDAATDGDARSDADASASPCDECDPHAACDIAREPPCYCTGGYEGDGTRCIEVVASLNELRWELPCGPTRDMYACDSGEDTDTATMNGDPGAEYLVELRFRGIVEEKTYMGGTQDGRWYVGGEPAVDTYNVYRFEISDPPQVYFLNAGRSLVTQCWLIDYTRVVHIRQGATVTLTAQSIDTREIFNRDASGMPLRVPDLVTDPDPYDGQFVQVDVLTVTKID